MFKFYTDGACSGNPGPGGWAFTIYDAAENLITFDKGYSLSATNNQMELQAVLQALLYFHSLDSTNSCEIYTDSAYICNAINQKWYIKWQQNGWHTTAKTEVANKNLWQMILNLYLPYLNTIKFIKVKAHSTNTLNNYVDELAVEARNQAIQEVNNEYININK